MATQITKIQAGNIRIDVEYWTDPKTKEKTPYIGLDDYSISLQSRQDVVDLIEGLQIAAKAYGWRLK